MTALQLGVLAGLLLGAAAAAGVWALVPAQPDLADALGRLGPQARRWRDPATPPGPVGDAGQRLGRWAMRALPAGVWGRPPMRELSLLRVPVDTFFGRKVGYALVLAVAPVLIVQSWALVGLGVPVTVPLVASLGLAGLGWVLPDVQVRAQAQAARVEFTRSVAAFVDLLAMARMAGDGANAAVSSAASIGDSWVFERLRVELAGRTRRQKEAWEVLAEVGDELGIPDLVEVAGLVREAGDAVAVYPQLRARGTSLRAALLAASKKQANEATQRMRLPMAFAGLAAFGLVVAPPILRLLHVT